MPSEEQTVATFGGRYAPLPKPGEEVLRALRRANRQRRVELAKHLAKMRGSKEPDNAE